MKIVILESLGISEDAFNELTAPLKERGHEIVYYEDVVDVEEQKERVKEADTLVIANMPLGADVINAAEDLKFIAVAFTGYDHVDLDACEKRGIKVSNAGGYSTHSVAELTFGLIIGLLRNVVPLEKVVREGGTKDGYSQNDLYGKTLGVIGTGAIGGKVCELGLAFGCNVVAYSRTEKEDLKEKGVKYLSLEDLLAESDIVTIHTPLTDQTKHLIGKEELEMMKDSALIINTGNGPIIDNDALAKALEDGVIAGAGLDRVDMEPPIPADYPLLDAPNTFIVPHIGFATDEALERRAEITFDNIEKWEDGAQENIVL